MALRVDDVLVRRTGLALYDPAAARAAATRVAALLGAEQGWSKEECEAAAARFDDGVSRMLAAFRPQT
jgi:glycerol-3-phosphate dehydrogenase